MPWSVQYGVHGPAPASQLGGSAEKAGESVLEEMRNLTNTERERGREQRKAGVENNSNPITVINNDSVCGHKIETKTSSACAEQKDEYISI